MSNELKALDELFRLTINGEQAKEEIVNIYRELIAPIETALKRLEKLEIMYSNCVIEGAKQKKALEIIKDNCKLYTESIFPLGEPEIWNFYLNMRGYLTDNKEKEEYELLKEVLK